MRGQLILEFIIAGLIFFAIIIYTINYLNISMTSFREKFAQDRLQSKAVQISEILFASESGLGIGDGLKFNLSKMQAFNTTYCQPYGDYKKLVEDFYLYENNDFGVSPNNAKIVLSSGDLILLDCGPTIPRAVSKAEISRVGIFNGEIAKLSITIW